MAFSGRKMHACIPHTYHLILEASIALCGSWWNNENGSRLLFLCSLARIPEFVSVPFVDVDASNTKHFRYGQECMFYAGKNHVASLGLKACLVHLHLPYLQYTCIWTLVMSSWLFASNWVMSMCGPVSDTMARRLGIWSLRLSYCMSTWWQYTEKFHGDCR